MKNSILFIFLVSLILCACAKRDDISSIPVNIVISDESAGFNSISFKLSASGDYVNEYTSWGIVYSESDDKSKGIEVIAEGTPADLETVVAIGGLEQHKTYYIWGWAEAGDKGRLWIPSCITLTTRAIWESSMLTGTVIGTQYSFDNVTGDKTTEFNTKQHAFDGNFFTYFASYDKSGTWVGLDLGAKHVISRIGYAPRISYEDDIQLAIIEGANEPDFGDALPLCMIKEKASSFEMHYVDVNCSRGFRYLRYVGPAGSRCHIAELEFYGIESEGNDSQMYQLTNLPTVVINTQDAKEIVSKEIEIPSVVYIISENGTDMLATKNTGVRGRGNASWSFPKKPYRLKFDEKQCLLGAPAHAKKWTLINNWGDKTLMRNILAFEVSRRVGLSYTPFCCPVDLVMNGEYKGTYQLCDQVEAAPDRVEAKDGYLIEIDAYADEEEVWFQSAQRMPVTIKHPDDDDITPEQEAFIEDYFNRMETAVFSQNFTDETDGYRKYLDLDSFLKNFIVGEFGGNTDTYWSVYMYKDAAEGKLYTGPVWDYDLAFENDARTHPILSLNDYIYCTRGSVASSAVKRMVSRIVKEDPKAKERLIELWEEACDKGNLTDLNAYIDETAALLQESQTLNFMRWDILDRKVHQNYQALGSYSAEVETVKNYVTGRLQHFDELIRK